MQIQWSSQDEVTWMRVGPKCKGMHPDKRGVGGGHVTPRLERWVPSPGEPGLLGATRSTKRPGRNPPIPAMSRPGLLASKRKGR